MQVRSLELVCSLGITLYTTVFHFVYIYMEPLHETYVISQENDITAAIQVYHEVNAPKRTTTSRSTTRKKTVHRLFCIYQYVCNK